MTGREDLDATTIETAELARLRQGFHRFFGATFLYPDPERIESLRSAASIFEAASLEAFAFHGAWVNFGNQLNREQDPLDIEAEYVRLFCPSTSGVLCPPNEAPYAGLRPGDTGQLLANLARDYANYGIGLAAGKGELPDHVSVQFEVMSYLCSCEASAWEERCADAAVAALRHQRAFLEAHLGQWFRLFAERVSKMAPETLYAGATQAADAFVQHELDLLTVLEVAAAGGAE